MLAVTSFVKPQKATRITTASRCSCRFRGCADADAGAGGLHECGRACGQGESWLAYRLGIKGAGRGEEGRRRQRNSLNATEQAVQDGLIHFFEFVQLLVSEGPIF